VVQASDSDSEKEMQIDEEGEKVGREDIFGDDLSISSEDEADKEGKKVVLEDDDDDDDKVQRYDDDAEVEKDDDEDAVESEKPEKIARQPQEEEEEQVTVVCLAEVSRHWHLRASSDPRDPHRRRGTQNNHRSGQGVALRQITQLPKR
jgi:hypothetical protein